MRAPPVSVPFAAARWLMAALLMLALVVVSSTAHALSGQQRKLIESYLKAASDGDRAGVVSMLHGGDVERFRTEVMKALDSEQGQGRSVLRDKLFGSASSLDELRRLTPPNFVLAMTRRLNFPSVPAKSIDPIGEIEEDSNTVHVVVRAWPEEKKKGASRLTLVTLRKLADKNWGLAIPDAFQAQVDAALHGGPVSAGAAATPAAPASTNSPEILQLIDNGTKLLSDGNCASYYTVAVSPSFRASKSDKAIKTLIQQCERSVDFREMYAAALAVARRSAPQMSADGKRAVYDLKGQGLPFETFTLERVEDRWFIAD